jgi:signal transduction histidine kinase
VRIRFFDTEAFRLSAIYAAIFAASVLVLGVLTLLITDRAFHDQIVQFSQADIAAVQNGYDNEGLHEAREVIQQSMAAPGSSDFFLLQKNGKAIDGNLPAMAPRVGIFAIQVHGHEILGVGRLLAPGVYAWSGSDLARARIAERDMVKTMAWLFAVALLLAICGGALVSRSFLKRSDAMGHACRAIMDGNLKARIPLRGTQDELDRLAGTINEMLDRIAALMENLRQVTNDIAHDLRTPVTRMRQGLERAADGPAAEHAAALDAAIRKTDDILALFAALLRIAQIEGGARRAAFTQVELAPLLFHMRELFGPVAEAAGHGLAVDISQEAQIRGDRALLIQLLSNLIENAILHTPAGTHITMSLARIDGHPALSVSDDGPGVPAEEHAKLFQRLYRREASRSSPGYGLGLSMVQAIAELHGAAIGVVPSPQGLCIRVLFPTARG